jgi:hypothetical protein
MIVTIDLDEVKKLSRFKADFKKTNLFYLSQCQEQRVEGEVLLALGRGPETNLRIYAPISSLGGGRPPDLFWRGQCEIYSDRGALTKEQGRALYLRSKYIIASESLLSTRSTK